MGEVPLFGSKMAEQYAETATVQAVDGHITGIASVPGLRRAQCRIRFHVRLVSQISASSRLPPPSRAAVSLDCSVLGFAIEWASAGGPFLAGGGFSLDPEKQNSKVR